MLARTFWIVPSLKNKEYHEFILIPCTTATPLKSRLKCNYHFEMKKNNTTIVFNTVKRFQISQKKDKIEKPLKPVLTTTGFL